MADEKGPGWKVGIEFYTPEQVIEVIRNFVKANYSWPSNLSALKKLLPPRAGLPPLFTVANIDWSKVGAPGGLNDPRLMRSILKYRTEGIPAAAPTGGLSSAAGAAVAEETGGPPPPGGQLYGPPVSPERRPPPVDWERFAVEMPELATRMPLAKLYYETQPPYVDPETGEVTWQLSPSDALSKAIVDMKGVGKVDPDKPYENTIEEGGVEYRVYTDPKTFKELRRIKIKDLPAPAKGEEPFVDWPIIVEEGGRKWRIVKRLMGVSRVTPDMEDQVWQMTGPILSETDITDPQVPMKIIERKTDGKIETVGINPYTGEDIKVLSTSSIIKPGKEVTPNQYGATVVTTNADGTVDVKFQLSDVGKAFLDEIKFTKGIKEGELALREQELAFAKEQAREAGRQASITQLTDAWNSAEAFSIEWARLGGEARAKSQAALNKFMTVGPGGPKGWAELVEGLRQQKAADIYDTQVTRLEEWKATLPSPLEGQISQAIAAGAAGKGVPGTNIAGWAPNLTPQMMAGRPQPPQVSFPQLPGNIPEPTALGVQTGDIDVVMRNWLAQNPELARGGIVDGEWKLGWFGQPQPRATGFLPTGFPRFEPPGELSRIGAGGGGQARRTFVR